MSDEPAMPSPAKRRPALLRVDTLADSVVILLMMTVLQRSIGFARGVLVCRWLDPEELGQWDMALGFLMLAAPIAVMSLPGAFGRYLEYYRQRGQLGTFLRRTTVACAALALATVTVICVNAAWFSQLVFGRPDRVHLIWLAAAALLGVVGYNFVTSIFTALRYYRVATGLQFLQSMSFAAVSLTLVAVWRQGAESMVIGFGLASLAAICIALLLLFKHRDDLQQVGASPPATQFWAKLVPFALWVWVIDWLVNLFGIVDRYMIVHFSGMAPAEALTQVGHYHSSRIIPLLFVAFAGMLGQMIMPHLSHDWEKGRREAVAQTTRLTLKAFAFAMSAGGVVVLLAAPFLFGVVLEGKYDGGLHVLPWTLVYCTWFGMTFISEKYLWCADQARLVSLAMFLGLLANIALNMVLLPKMGLLGAVLATTAANAVALSLIYLMGNYAGMRVDAGTWLVSAAPLLLQLGPWPALAVLALVALAAAFGHHLLSPDEKKAVRQTCEEYLARIRQLRGRRTAPA